MEYLTMSSILLLLILVLFLSHRHLYMLITDICIQDLSNCTAEVMSGQHCSYNLSKCSAGGMSPTPAIHCFNDSEECGENCGKDFNECFQGIGNYPEMFNRNQSV